MSGHSHWATIQRKKGAADQKRGQVFSRLSREISVAARAGADPETNFKLRLVVEKAKATNMAKDKIEAAIKRGSGGGEKAGLSQVVYEGFGPGKVGIIVEALTDNRQRTTAEIRKIFEKRGGSLAGPGAVVHQFKRMGFLVVDKGQDPQETILKIIDQGVEDVEEVEDGIEVYTQPKALEAVRQSLVKLGLKVKSFTLARKPMSTIAIKDKNRADQVLGLMDELEDHDDVQQTEANFNIDPELL